MGKETNLKGGALLGGSDPPVSPGFSLYPDDSLSATEDQNWAVPKLVKGQEYSQESGDGEDSITISDEGATLPGVASRRLSRAREQRSDDRPPRVPSPPVLPSLAQMAMGDGEYRSPTYSLYGLYS